MREKVRNRKFVNPTAGLWVYSKSLTVRASCPWHVTWLTPVPEVYTWTDKRIDSEQARNSSRLCFAATIVAANRPRAPAASPAPLPLVPAASKPIDRLRTTERQTAGRTRPAGGTLPRATHRAGHPSAADWRRAVDRRRLSHPPAGRMISSFWRHSLARNLARVRCRRPPALGATTTI